MAQLQCEHVSQNLPSATDNNRQQQQSLVPACLPSRSCTWELVTHLLQKAMYVRQCSLTYANRRYPSPLNTDCVKLYNIIQK